jgi:hypothetical protein
MGQLPSPRIGFMESLDQHCSNRHNTAVVTRLAAINHCLCVNRISTRRPSLIFNAVELASWLSYRANVFALSDFL